MKKALKIVLIIVISIVVLLGLGTGAFFVFNKPQLTADFSKQGSEISNGASGFLYGLAEPDIPTAEIAESIDISTVAQKTYGGLQHPIGDINQVADTFLKAGGETLIVYTQDMYDTWYYKFDSMPEYLEKVRKTVTDIEAADYSDKVVYCIFNEMNNGQWFGDFSQYDNRIKFYEAWKQTFELVKSINPKAQIGGPGYYDFNEAQLKEFLQYCTQNNCVPEVMIWHELGTNSLYYWNEHFERYYAICDELSITKMPVNISEYGLMETNGIPGESVKWINRIENTDCTACMAYWRLANNLSDVVSDDVMPNSNWWVYRWYSEMSGKEVELTDSDIMQSNVGKYLKGKSDKLLSKGFTGVATVDDENSVIQVLAGGSDDNSVINLKNLDKTASFKDVDRVSVKVEYVSFKGLSGAVTESKVKEYYIDNISHGKLKIELNDIMYSDGYLVTVKPATQEELSDEDFNSKAAEKISNPVTRYEAEDAKLFGTAQTTTNIAYAASHYEMVKADSSKQSGVEYKIKVDSADSYNLDFVYGNGANGITYDKDGKAQNKGERTNLTAFVQIDDNTAIPFELKNTVKDDFTDCFTYAVDLVPGVHKIKVYIEQNKDVNNTVAFDFLDVSACDSGFSQLIADKDRTTNNSSAFIAIAAKEGYYTVQFDSCVSKPTSLSINSQSVNGCEFKQLDNKYEAIVYLRRGLSYIEVNAKTLSGQFFLVDGEINGNTVRLNSTDAIILGTATLEDDDNSTSGKHIGYISCESLSGASFIFNADKEGLYQITFHYANNEEGGVHDYNVDLVERYISLDINNKSLGNIYFRSTQSWQTYKTKTVMVELVKGQNAINLLNDGSYRFNGRVTYAPDIDYIEVSPITINN